MAHPWIFESNFEAGSNAEWDSEADTGSRLDFPHYSALAKIPGMPAPYRGAYCMRIQMGDTNDHTLIEGDIDIADTVTRWSSFMLHIGSDVDATADDTWNIYEVQGTANAVENAVGFRYTAATDLLEIGVGQTAPTAFAAINKGRWYHIELKTVVQTGGTGTGTLYVDGRQVAEVDTLTNTAVLRGVLGTQNTLSTTTGTLLFKDFKFDDAQVYPPNQRFPDTVRLTKSAHVFVGPGAVDSATLLSSTGTMDVYDTDVANTNDASAKRIQLDTSGNFVSHDSTVHFLRGCYVVLSGTNPVGEIRLHRGPQGPTAHWSDGAIRNYGAKRQDRPGNV